MSAERRHLTREEARGRIAIALDVDTAPAARELAGRLQGRSGWLKVGLQLFAAAGGPLVREMSESGSRIFLDVKLHDIPNTVAGAAIEAVRCGAAMLNVHATGGIAMMRAAAEAVDREARRLGRERPRLVAVTALTSLDESDLAELGLLGPAEEMVLRLAALSRRAGCDGVVCSAREIASVRARCGDDFLIVTPGIRPHGERAPRGSGPPSDAGGGAVPEDQKRTATPGAALAAGADLIVLGRAVTAASDPAAALEKILDGIEAGE